MDKTKRRKDKKRGKDKEKRIMPRKEPYKRIRLTLEDIIRYTICEEEEDE